MRLLFILSFAPLLFSFKFNPMSQSIELAEDQKSAQFTVENDTPETMAIELTVRERIMDDLGKEINPKVEGMTIFPPQMIIPSKEKRTVRVTWNGGKVESERAFRVIAEQLPLKVDEKTKRKSGIQMLMRYMAALYVNPKDSEPKISTLIQKVTASELTLLVTNDGNKHQVLM